MAGEKIPDHVPDGRSELRGSLERVFGTHGEVYNHVNMIRDRSGLPGTIRTVEENVLV